ncbi:MAG: type II toxin-antitoxin system death-on-curing family toxin [Rubrobacteraceae bacterium]|nr:type II toxin-antitoxin system death-on-curing family toxin [Rubrobacter sp.]
MSEERTVAVEDLVWIHSAAIARYGGASGIRDAGSLEAAVARPYTSFGGTERFLGPFAKAAALMESIIQRHPFVDGNKRTGVASAVYLLRIHDYRLAGVSNAALVELALDVAAHRMNLDDLARWFEDHAESG